MGQTVEKAYIWDLDGTLLDSYGVIVSSVLAACRSFGFSVTEEEAHRQVIQHSALALLEKYDAVRTASCLEGERQDSEEEGRKRIWMFLGHNGGTYLGSPKLEKYRRVIVCTKEPCMLFVKKKLLGGYEPVLHLEEGSVPIKRANDFLAMPAGDIECYNPSLPVCFLEMAVLSFRHAGDAHFPSIISCDYTSECLDGRLDGGQVSFRVDLRRQFHAKGRQYAPDVLPG